MPPPKVTAWILKPRVKPFEFFDEDGTSRHLPIFFNEEKQYNAIDAVIPNSDAFEAEPSNQWEMMQLRLGRKRTGSEVSKSSSSERDASCASPNACK